MERSPVRIGVDLGGTKTEIAAFGPDDEPRYRKRVLTPAKDYEAVLACVRELVEEAEQDLRLRASVGVGIPGSRSPTTGRWRNANTTSLNGRLFDQDLARALGREVRVENDANCFALSEAVDGAGKAARVVFGVILGTGTGGGVVVDRRVLTGKNGVGGEWGHNPLPWPEPNELPGPSCFCGKRGCIETFVSGVGLARDFASSSGALDSAEIVGLAEHGDAAARAALGRYFDRLARALASVINVLDPDVVVLGGGMSKIRALYDELPSRLPDYVFSDHVSTPVLPAVHGDAGGVRGAAWLWPGARDA